MSYSFSSMIRYSEIGEDMLLSLPGALDYFQDCVSFQAEAIGQGIEIVEARRKAWVLNAWQVDIRRRPKLAEKVEITTIPYEFRGFLGIRNFLMTDQAGERLIWANSSWSNINLDTGHPERLTEEDMAGYDLDQRLDMEYAPRKITVPDHWEQGEAFSIQKHHLDTHHHVNNCQYVRMALNYLPENFTVKRLRVEYKAQALLGDVFYPLVMEKDEKFFLIFSRCSGIERPDPYAILEFS